MRSSDERGFTLVELLIAITISGLLSTALGGAIVIGLKSTSNSTVQLAQSRDIQLVQGALPRDVFTATGVKTNVAAGTGTCSGQATLLDLTWSTPSLVTGSNGPPTTTLQNYEVDYVYSVNAPSPPAAQTGSLTRKLYTGTAPSSCTLLSSSVVASSLSKNSALQTATLSGATVTLTLTDSSCTKEAVGAQLRAATTSTTAATTTTTAPTCTG
jgi:prepilin-type N-terminal cleavage/methylation domain-containing protein